MQKFKSKFNLMLTGLSVVALLFVSSCGSDDPAPAVTISFSSTTASVMESGDPLTVTVNFSGVSGAEGTFTATVSGDAVYTDDYTTDPAVENGAISFTVAEGDATKTFTLTPVDNDEFTGDKTVTFTLTGATGVDLGTDAAITVTIADDETEPTSIADLRANFATNGASTLGDAVIIEGVVTSSMDNITGRNMYIQDATAGIVIRFDDDNTTLALGDQVRIDASGTSLGDFNGLVQVSDVPNASAMKIGDGTLPTPEMITITQLLTDDFQGKVVTLTDVAFDGADGEATYNGSQGISDAAGNETSTFVRSDAAFSGDVLPAGVGTITGIASSFSNTPQIDLRTAADVSVTASATITIDAANITDFGQVEVGTTSTAQPYTVTGSGLLADINVSVSSNFELSLESDANYASSITIPMSSTSAVTVYVRFVPNSMVNDAINGTITHTTFSAIGQTVSVSGEEIGNGATGSPTELFFSEYIEGSSNNKYLEIYNGTDAGIDLADYEIHRYNNGASESPATVALSGTIAAGTVIVIANDQATLYDGTVYSATDANSATFFNGDDAVVLYKVSTTSQIDIIGQIGCDPGSNWADGDHSTGNKTLRRKASITAGVTTNPTGECGATSFATLTTEWDVFDQDTADGLGAR